VYAVRDIEALFEVAWSAAKDPDSDFVGYTYQLATDPEFNNLIWHKPTGRVRSLKLREQNWYSVLGNAAVNQPVTLYQRVIASDGKHLTYGEATPLQLMKSDQPLEDFVEVPAPEYVFDGKIHETGAGSGAQWDKYGKLWLADYYGKLIVKQPDGQDAPFSPLQQVTINGKTYDLNTINGIGVDRDGNILVGRNRLLIKIDAATGQGIAVWEVPEGNRAITSPRANDKGEIYLTSLFAEDNNYVLRQNATDPSTFDLVRTIELPGRILAREFDMTPDGLTLYFPNPGSPYIQQYSSKDGITYTRQEDITSIAAGCNAIAVGPGNTVFTAVRSSGVVPSTFHFRDDTKKRMWTLPLPELNGAEARGIGVSANGDTLIFCSWDKGGGFYRYVLRKEAGKKEASIPKAPASKSATSHGDETMRKED
jgi:dipeptidyl aminopeptidase/acylaminoacyl peptidase